VSAFLDCVSCLFSSINRFFFLALPKKGQPMSASSSTIATFFAALMTAALAVGSASAEVVYGNLGPTGTGTIATGGGVGLTSTTWRAIGFIPGGTDLELETVNLGLSTGAGSGATIRLDLYNDNAGVPGTSFFNTTQSLPENSPSSIISFTLNQTLTSGTTYWAVARRTSGTSPLAWRPTVAPTLGVTPQNSSGWQNLGADSAFNSSNSGSSWTATGTGSSTAISFVAVPEPSVFAMLIGVAIPFAGWRIKRLRG
jgi:hypothetical protein